MHAVTGHIVETCVGEEMGTIVLDDLKCIREHGSGETRNHGRAGALELHTLGRSIGSLECSPTERAWRASQSSNRANTTSVEHAGDVAEFLPTVVVVAVSTRAQSGALP